MKKLTYAQQLAHPSWQRRRLEMLSAADWKCVGCGATEEQLHVHHRIYIKGRMAWEYADNELAVLCSKCHGLEHEAKDLLDELLLTVPQKRMPIRVALAFLSNYFTGSSDIYNPADESIFDVAIRAADGELEISGAGAAGCIASMLEGLSVEAQIKVMAFINGLRAQEGLDER